MTIARLLTACAVAGGAVLFAAAPADADVAVAVALVVPGGAGCPAGYSEVARSDRATLCYHVEDPDWKLLVDGSPCGTAGDTGWTEYAVLDTVRLCVRT
ncbi:MAG TPA: hypothetical protein VGX28_11615 [Frankiaceae bacterium]|jgi:hypothetical protein|nr:hypothetical protein [Frankiaceae bacterium]